ncbi:phospholipase effector Tle1 domain-containing protein [Streptomyces sp. NPDC102476]|uniref:phospholipase effector Tle1 domain-containing protein n=1 Tax=Streptomyces sp. NPDC102476 TaxID=3366181 RepID=UPI003810F2BB
MRTMGQNIIICCDGTGNTFAHHSTNLTRMIQYLALDDHTAQIAVYDQGVGAAAERMRAVHEYRNSLEDPLALRVPPAPGESGFPPRARWTAEGIVIRLRTHWWCPHHVQRTFRLV